jgi:hypothetical protein
MSGPKRERQSPTRRPFSASQGPRFIPRRAPSPPRRERSPSPTRRYGSRRDREREHEQERELSPPRHRLVDAPGPGAGDTSIAGGVGAGDSSSSGSRGGASKGRYRGRSPSRRSTERRRSAERTEYSHASSRRQSRERSPLQERTQGRRRSSEREREGFSPLKPYSSGSESGSRRAQGSRVAVHRSPERKKAAVAPASAAAAAAAAPWPNCADSYQIDQEMKQAAADWLLHDTKETMAQWQRKEHDICDTYNTRTRNGKECAQLVRDYRDRQVVNKLPDSDHDIEQLLQNAVRELDNCVAARKKINEAHLQPMQRHKLLCGDDNELWRNANRRYRNHEQEIRRYTAVRERCQRELDQGTRAASPRPLALR